MKINDKVLVCWDGKSGRARLGKVMQTHYGNKILVRYSPHYSEDVKVTEQWFKVLNRSRGVKRIGGWTTKFGWCSVVKPKKLISLGVSPYWNNHANNLD